LVALKLGEKHVLLFLLATLVGSFTTRVCLTLALWGTSRSFRLLFGVLVIHILI
jgi:hypothetical protein